MGNNLTKNYFYNLAYQILLIISPVITMPFLSRSLGASGIGEYSYSYTLTGYFVLAATLGCDVYGRREISYVKDSIEERNKRFWSIQAVKTISTLLVLSAYIIFSLYDRNTVMLIILGFHLLNVPLNIGWFYQGIENFKTLSIRGFALKFLDLLFVLVFIHDPDDLLLYVFGTGFIALLSFLVLWVDLKKYILFCRFDCTGILRDFKNSFVFFLPSIATSIYTLLDKTMLGIITGNYLENGYYEQAYKINQVFLKIVLSFGIVLLPSIAYSYKTGKIAKVQESIRKSMTYVFFVAFPIAAGLFCISDLVVPWFFGEDFLKVADILKISGFIIIFQGMNDVFGIQYLVSVGRQKAYIVSLFTGALVNFICNLMLIPRFGSTGAVCASLISECIIVIMQAFYSRKELKVSSVISSAPKYAAASLVMMGLLMFLSGKLSPTILNTILLTGLGCLIYFGILIIIRDSMVLKIVSIIKDNPRINYWKNKVTSSKTP